MNRIVVSLTREELLLLDNKCSDGVQEVINDVKTEHERFNEIENYINNANLEEQDITHCVVCKDSINKLASHKKNKNLKRKIRGYFLGRDEHSKSILICKDCYKNYVQTKLQ